MLIHRQYIKENLSSLEGKELKKATDALSFFFYVKSRVSNSLIYNYYNNEKQAINYICNLSEKPLDKRTVSRYLQVLFKMGLLRKRKGHLLFVSIAAEYQYKLLPNGKNDKKSHKRFYRFKIDSNDVFRQIRAQLRLIVAKLRYQATDAKVKISQVLSSDRPSHFGKGSHPLRYLYNLKKGRAIGEKMLPQRIGIFKLAKLMGVSKSTAYRTMEELEKMDIVKIFHGEVKNVCKYTPEVQSKVEKNGGFPRGFFLSGKAKVTKLVGNYSNEFSKVVLRKSVNEYCF